MLLRSLLCLCLTGLSALASDLPAYLQQALAHFNPVIPPEWAYTITTVRGSESSVERFDPSLPVERQWTLVQRNNRPASPEDSARSNSYRTSTSANPHAAFNRNDIDLDSLQLISEGQEHALFRTRFREDIKDPLLHQLELQLSVSKSRATVEQFHLVLMAPYSPVLTVKMLELRVDTSLSHPTADRPALPIRVDSRFRGRIFLFKSIEEDVRTSYSDFTRVQPLAPSRLATPP